MAARKPTPKRILVIDVGGTHVKLRLGAQGPIRRFVSGPGMTPTLMLRRIGTPAGALKFDAVSIGYPGVVLGGIAANPPAAGWVGFDFCYPRTPVRSSMMR
jgi:predicted NBD/HSP70 family sugar kinase